MRSMTRLATLDGWPIQIGRPRMKISVAMIFSRSFGQSSPFPMSDKTPGLMSWSRARTTSPFTPCGFRAESRSATILSVDDFSLSLEAFSEQLMAKAVRDIPRLLHVDVQAQRRHGLAVARGF